MNRNGSGHSSHERLAAENNETRNVHAQCPVHAFVSARLVEAFGGIKCVAEPARVSAEKGAGSHTDTETSSLRARSNFRRGICS